MNLGSIWDPFRIDSGSIRAQFGFDLGSIWGPFGVDSDQYGLDLESIRGGFFGVDIGQFGLDSGLFDSVCLKC